MGFLLSGFHCSPIAPSANNPAEKKKPGIHPGSGLVTFAGTSAASITLDQAIAAVQSVVATSNGETAVFTYTTSGVTDTYVFNNNTTDSVVKLVGISAAALITTNDATTDNGIFIS